MPDVRLPSFASSKPVNAHLVRTALASDASSALRLAAFAVPSWPTGTGRRQQACLPCRVRCTVFDRSHRRFHFVLSRPAHDLPASGAPALPESDTTLLPSPGAAARAGLIPVRLRVHPFPFTSVQSGGSAPAFKTCRQPSRAGASVSAYTSRKPNPGMQRTRCARR